MMAAYEACEHGAGAVRMMMWVGPWEGRETVELVMSHHKSEAEAVRKRTIWESYAGMHHLY